MPTATSPTFLPDQPAERAFPLHSVLTCEWNPRGSASAWVRDLNRAIETGETPRVVPLLNDQIHTPSLGDLNEAWGEGAVDESSRRYAKRPLSVRRPALQRAIGTNGGTLVPLLLAHPGIDPNVLDHWGRSPLHTVSTLTTVRDPVGLMQALLNVGADPFQRAVHPWHGARDVPGVYRVQGQDHEGRLLDEHRLEVSLVEAVVAHSGQHAGQMLDVLDRHGAVPSDPSARWRLIEMALSMALSKLSTLEDRQSRPRSAVRWLLEQHPEPMTAHEGERLLKWAAPLTPSASATFRCVEGAVLTALVDQQRRSTLTTSAASVASVALADDRPYQRRRRL